MKQFFDTNVLLYQFDDANPAKRDIAHRRVADALGEARFVISTQVMMEFYANITGKFSRAMSTASAQRLLSHWSDSGLAVAMTPEMVVDAASIAQRHALSWWDATIVIAAQRADADVLVSEDLQHRQRFGKLCVENPFLTEVHEPQAEYQ